MRVLQEKKTLECKKSEFWGLRVGKIYWRNPQKHIFTPVRVERPIKRHIPLAGFAPNIDRKKPTLRVSNPKQNKSSAVAETAAQCRGVTTTTPLATFPNDK